MLEGSFGFTVSTEAQGALLNTSHDILVDATNSGAFFIDAITPGVALQTASGHDYTGPGLQTAIPEPASSFLLATAALVIAGLRRRGPGFVGLKPHMSSLSQDFPTFAA